MNFNSIFLLHFLVKHHTTMRSCSKKINQMSTRIKQKCTIRSLAILCFPLSGVLLFDESESSFIRFSTAVSLGSVSFIFEVKAFCWSIKCCNIACCYCRNNIISVCEWNAPAPQMSKI